MEKKFLKPPIWTYLPSNYHTDLLITMVNMSYPGWFNPKKPYQDSIGSSNNRNKSLSAFRACLPDAPIWAKLLVKDEHWPDDSVTAAAADFWRPAQLSLPSPNLHSKWSAKAVLFNSFNDDDAPALESWHLGWEHGWFDDSLNNIFLNEKSHLNLYVLRVFIHKYIVKTLINMPKPVTASFDQCAACRSAHMCSSMPTWIHSPKGQPSPFQATTRCCWTQTFQY